MATTIKATYKQFNGTDWDTVYFKTSAGQVGEVSNAGSTGLVFLRPYTHTVNGKSFMSSSNTHQGITLYGSDIKLNSSSTKTLEETLNEITGSFDGLDYLPTSGGTLTGDITFTNAGGGIYFEPDNTTIRGAGIGADDQGQIAFKTDGFTIVVADRDDNSDSFDYLDQFHTYRFPDKDGTFALTSDLTNLATKDVATTSANGLMSSTDKTNLNTLVALLNDNDSDTTINTIREVLNAFANVSEGTDIANVLANKQPLDADLTAIAGLTGTSGFLRKTAANTWMLDTNTYVLGVELTGHLQSIDNTYLKKSGGSMTGDITFTNTGEGIYFKNRSGIGADDVGGLVLRTDSLQIGVADRTTQGENFDMIEQIYYYNFPDKDGTFALTSDIYKIYTGSTTPTGMKTGDIWIQYN